MFQSRDPPVGALVFCSSLTQRAGTGLREKQPVPTKNGVAALLLAGSALQVADPQVPRARCVMLTAGTSHHPRLFRWTHHLVCACCAIGAQGGGGGADKRTGVLMWSRGIWCYGFCGSTPRL
eukprot:308334-Rhodomonas_salina.1